MDANTNTDPSTDTSSVTIRVFAINPIVGGGRLLALADAEIHIDGVVFAIHGLQVFADAGKTEIRLPKYRAPNGEWLAAITLPPELREPLADAVMAAGIEAGILRERPIPQG